MPAPGHNRCITGKTGRSSPAASSIKKRSGPSWLLPPVSALLLIGAFPRFEQGWLAWLALMPLLWFSLHSPPRRALIGGLLFGLPLHLYLNLYLINLFLTYLTPGPALLTALGLISALSLFYALFTLSVSLTGKARPLTRAWLIPSCWVAMEYLRSLGFLGYTAGFLGYTQWRYPGVLNLAAGYGYWGLPFLMIAAQTLVVLFMQKRLSKKEVSVALGVWGFMLVAGLLLPQAWAAATPEQPLRVALIQGNSTPEEIFKNGKEPILQRYLELTRQAVAETPGVSLVVWPETVVDLNGPEPAHPREMDETARELAVNLLYGARLDTGESLFNAIVLLAPDHPGFETYHKQRLVPFVEYCPLEKVLNSILALDFRLGCYRAGNETSIFNVEGVPLAGVVCFESYFGDLTRRFAARDAVHLFVLTNDGWFGGSTALEQHAQVAAIRAAEMGLGVTQVANSGLTVSYDYRGRERLRLGKQLAETFTVDLDLTGRPTPYRLLGDYFPMFWNLCLAGYVIASLSKLKAEA